MVDPRVRRLYKQLIFAARDYPAGLDKARQQLKAAFRRVPEDSEAVRQALVAGGGVLPASSCRRQLARLLCRSPGGVRVL